MRNINKFRGCLTGGATAIPQVRSAVIFSERISAMMRSLRNTRITLNFMT